VTSRYSAVSGQGRGPAGLLVRAATVHTMDPAASPVTALAVRVVYRHHSRFPRTRAGLEKVRKALSALAADPPAGLGVHPVVWWLAEAPG
jgi:hypothetical protein